MAMPRTISVLALAVLLCGGHFPLAAQEPDSQFYRGKTVTIVVGTTAGGPLDSAARLIGRYFGKHLPANPTVVVTNMPGAGSDIAAAYVARVAPKDGTYIAAPFGSEPLDPILEDAGSLNFDPSRINYLGSALSDETVCIVRRGAPATAFDDMFKQQIVMGGTAENGVTGYMPVVLDNVIGTKFKVVVGYPGSREIMLAIQKAEIDGACGLFLQGLESQYADQMKSGEIRIVAQESETGIPELNKLGIPLTISYAHDDQERRVLGILYSQGIFARPYFSAAEVPVSRLQILRRAFTETLADPDLLDDAAKTSLLVVPTSGEAVQSLLQKIYASPQDLLQRVRSAIKPK
jgi:tripartite-type tricarboxylate transporter receptor subunit TctC